MTEPATWMVGITHAEDHDGDSKAYVALGLGYGPRIDLPPEHARQVARQLLLCAEDAEKFNKAQDEPEETAESAVGTSEDLW